MTVIATRLLDGVELPAPGTWTIDPGHAEVAFIGRHFMLTKVRGRFTSVRGAITIAEDPSQSQVEVTIDTASVSSGDQARDDHLRSADFFDVDAYPTATYRSSQVLWAGSRGTMRGELTIKGLTRPVTLEVDYLGHIRDPWGADRAIFSAAGTLNREDWQLTWNMPLETGGVLVSNQIRLEIEVETVHQAP